nr:GIY-YIG nuclease family protein [Mesorhizobium sp. M7A.T.Ca.TU.009.02.1.1]
MTSDLKRRLAEHNSGNPANASKFLPWRIVTHMAFPDQAKAASFEVISIRFRARFRQQTLLVTAAGLRKIPRFSKKR